MCIRDSNTSTPISASTSEFVLPSLDLSPVRLSDQSEDSYEYFPRMRPRRIEYSDSSADLLRPDLPDGWSDRLIKRYKYIDDCLTVQKVYMKRAERFHINGKITALSVAPKTGTLLYSRI